VKEFPRWVKIAIGIALMALAATGAWFYREQEMQVMGQVEGELLAIARLKVNQIKSWRAERLGDAGALMDSPFLADGVARFIAGPRGEPENQLRSRFKSLQARYNYSDVILTTTDGSVLLSLSGRTEKLHCAEPTLTDAFRDHAPALTELHTEDHDKQPHIGVVAPIFSGAGPQQKPIGAIILICDAREFLYPLIQSWPVPSETAETLLVRRDGNNVLFLNDLRHQKDTALKLRIPLTRKEVPAVTAVEGRTGIVYGTDYRGVSVVSAVMPVPGSSWFIVAKMDSAEAFAAWRNRSVLIMALTLAAAILIIASALVVMQRNRKAYYRARYRAEAALRAGMERYGVTLKSIGDAVIATDRDGNVELLNKVAEDLTGWKSDDAQGKPLDEVFRIVNEQTRATVENPVARVLREGVTVGLANHTVLIARDGTERAIADSGAPIRDEKGAITGVVLVFRDQTAEMEAQAAIQRSMAALRESEDRYRDLVEHSQDLICTHDLDGNILSANPASEKMLGYPSGAFIGMNLRDFLAPETRHLIETYFTEIRERGASSGLLLVQTKTGERRIWEYRNTLRSEGVPFPIVRGLAHDITERRRAQEARRREEEKFRAVFDESPIGKSMVLPDGSLSRINRAFAEMLGYTVDEMTGLNFRDITHPDDLAESEECVRSIISGEKNEQQFQKRYLHKDGRIVWTLVTTKLFRDERGNPVFLLTSILDITERLRAAEEIRAQRDFAQNIFDTAQTIILVLDTEGRIVSFNSYLESISGYRLDEVRGRDWFSTFLPERDHENIRRLFKNAIGDIQTHGNVNPILTKDGRLLEIEWYDKTLKDSAGRTTGILSTGQDVTERKRAEKITQIRLDLFEYAATHSLEDLLRKTLDEVCEMTGSPIGFYHFMEPDQKTLSLQAWSTRTTSEFCTAEGRGAHYDLDKAGVWVDCVRERRPVIHNDYASLPHRRGLPKGHAAITRELVVPIMRLGKIVAILGVGNKARDYDEKDMELVSYLADVAWESAERKRTEEALLETQSLLNDVGRIAKIGGWKMDLTTRKATWTKDTYDIVEIEPGQPIPGPDEHVQYYLPEYRPIVAEAMRALIEEDKPLDFDAKLLTARGNVKWCRAIGRAIRKDGKAVEVYGTFQDITERKRAEEAMQVQSEIVANMAEGVHLVRLDDGVIVYANPRLEEMFGYETGEMLGKHISIVNAPGEKTPEETYRIVTKMLQETGHMQVEVRNIRKDGSTFWCYANAVVFDHPTHGRVALSVHTDITERKLAEEEKEKLQAQLLQSQKMESVGRLAGGVAHDFNNLLTVILGRAQLALARMDHASPMRPGLLEIYSTAQRAADLTRQLLAFARKQTIVPKVLDLNETVEGMLKILRRLIGEDIDLVWAPGRDLWQVKMDPAQIDQMLANLSVNARDAIAGVGRIAITTANETLDTEYCAAHTGARPGQYVMLTVSDSGCGMDEGVMTHLFEPFFTTKGVGQGTGLGLVTVYGIVKQNEGYIAVDSAPGMGSTFRIYLPRYVGEEASAAATEPASEAEPIKGGGETVLVVEDDAVILGLCREVLEPLGYAVIAADSPQKAIRMAQAYKGEIQLLITDVVMPGMTGRALAERLMVGRPNLKRIFMSGYTADVIAHRGVLDPGVNFIEKPFSIDDLAARVREVLEGGESPEC